MSSKTRQSFVCLCLLMMLSSACSNAAQPAAGPTATRELQRNPNVDMQPILRNFLANLPADWNLVASRDVAKLPPFIVDVRQPDEYNRGFIAGAVNIPLRELARNLTALPGMDKDIVVVCGTGHRGAIGMAVLQMLGYTQAKTLDGGMQAWQAAQQPVVTAPVPPRPAGQAPNVNLQIQAMLDYYLVHTLPLDWGVLGTDGLTADQKLRPSSSAEAQPETYDQGPSLLIDVGTAEEFGQSAIASFKRAINLPLQRLPDALDNMPLQETIDWA